MEYKRFTLQLKADKPGHFSAVIATLNVKDHDSDVTLPGAFPDGKEIVMSAYQHGSWEGALPVGKGIIREVNNEIVVEGEFNLNSETGKEHYETIKFMGGLQEYSYGFNPLEYEFGEFEEDEVRFLKRVDPHEFSPVLKGAGIGTRTMAIKNDNDSQPLANQSEHVLADVQALTARVKALAALRREEGRTISPANREALEKLDKEITGISQEVKTLLADTDPSVKDEGQKAFLEFLKIQMEAR